MTAMTHSMTAMGIVMPVMTADRVTGVAVVAPALLSLVRYEPQNQSATT